MQRNPPLSLHSNLPHYDESSSEDEEAEKQERFLSREYGEATERGGGRNNINTSRKRTHPHHQQTDAEIINALNSSKAGNVVSNANDGDGTSNGETKTKRVKRVVLTESKLTGSKGLIQVRNGFPLKVQYREPRKLSMKDLQGNYSKSKKSFRGTHNNSNNSRSSSEQRRALKRKQLELDVRASATYISKLMKAYHDFALDIAPNMHPIDTFRRIEALGSKKQVREYLDTMREEVCKEHLKKMYGSDRAEKLVNELESGLKAHQEKIMDGGDDDNDKIVSTSSTQGSSNGESGDQTNTSISNNLRATRNVGVLVESNDQISNEMDGERVQGTVSSSKEKDDDTGSVHSPPEKQGENAADKVDDKDNDNDDDDGDENEATFDENVGESNKINSEDNQLENDSVNKNNENQKDDDVVEDEENKAEENEQISVSKGPKHKSDTPTEEDSEKQQVLDEDEEMDESQSNAEVIQNKITYREMGSKDDQESTNCNVELKGSISEEKGSEEASHVEDTEPFGGDEVSGTEQEASMIVELTPPTQDMDTEEGLVIDASQSVGENNPDVPAMTQNTLSQFDDTYNDDLIQDTKQSDDPNKSQDFDETQTIIPTMTPNDFISQEY